MISFQGNHFEDALEEASGIIKEHSLLLHKTIPYTLPGKDSQRNILVFMKESKASSPEGRS